MTIIRGHFYWLYPLFWVDFLLQFFSFYFYYMYPRQFQIRAYTFFRTSVYIHEVMSMLAKLSFFFVFDGYDGAPTEIPALVGVFCCILLMFTENFVYYNKAYDSIWTVPNCIALTMLLLKVGNLLEMSFTGALWLSSNWLMLLIYLNSATGLFWFLGLVVTMCGWVNSSKKSFYFYQFLQSVEMIFYGRIQLLVYWLVDSCSGGIVSNGYLGFASLVFCCSIAGGIQLIILGMQFKYSTDADSLQIDTFDGLQFPEDQDLYVHERHSYTLQIDDQTPENERTTPLVEAEPSLQAA